MYKILIIEDDLVMAGAIKKEMEAWGNEARYVEDFAKVLEIFAEYGPHLVLLDITLPFYNGYHWCSEIRKISSVPVIFISSAADNMNIIMAMNMGGDDFVAKPFDLSVLTAKIQALLRRTYDLSGKVPMLEHRGAILNLYDTTMTYNGEKIELTKNEFRILQTLMENKGRVVSRDTLMTKLWETDNYIEENTLTVNVGRLRKKLLWSLLCAGIFFLIFVLEEINLKAAVYPTVLCLAFGLLFLLCGYLRYKKTRQKLEHLLQGEGPYEDSLPVAQDGIESGYQELIRKEEQQQRKEHARWEKSGQDMEDYYATWVHQIKAPIAVMNVLLQQEDTETNQNLKAELFRVEQYVEMALGYVRLDSGTKDLVIARYPLDEIVRKSIRKYAGQFIRRRIRLIYEGTDQIVLTDEKWLSFIIEQLLSNAVKYTLKGTVTITVSEEKKLTVTDTGMGIAPEDLPRIFEKGYTGYNGRMERKSTGIGLYLSQMAAKKLGHQITVESKLGEGSSFTIDLAEYPLRAE